MEGTLTCIRVSKAKMYYAKIGHELCFVGARRSEILKSLQLFFLDQQIYEKNDKKTDTCIVRGTVCIQL